MGPWPAEIRLGQQVSRLYVRSSISVGLAGFQTLMHRLRCILVDVAEMMKQGAAELSLMNSDDSEPWRTDCYVTKNLRKYPLRIHKISFHGVIFGII